MYPLQERIDESEGPVARVPERSSRSGRGRNDTYGQRPGDIALPPTTSIDVSHLVRAALDATSSVTDHTVESER